jgi:hypothetical protein
VAASRETMSAGCGASTALHSTMSLLRACPKRILGGALRPLAVPVRHENTTAFNAALVKEVPENALPPVPAVDVVAADAVSGAPGAPL